jgi:uncharacterized membrane-anchored protein YhcB (DUF1043 family)
MRLFFPRPWAGVLRMTTLTDVRSWIVSNWSTCLVIVGSTIGALAYNRLSETVKNRALRDEQKRKKELSRLANQIYRYARHVHQHYPTGDVVVSEADLAKQLRKPPDIVATALNVLLGQKRAQRASLEGFWKLKV